MTLTRRNFLTLSAAAGAGLAASCASSRSAGTPAELPFRISLAQWSLHRALYAHQIDPLDFPVIARRDYGIEGCEYVNSFCKDHAADAAHWTELKKRCTDHGVQSLLIMCDGEGSLAESDAEARRQAVENHKKWLEAAAFLGCHSIRVNAHGSGTPDAMAAAMADSLVQLAEWNGHSMNVIVENHGGLSSDAGWLVGVMKRAAHARVGTLPDFGNFRISDSREYDRYQGVKEMMPYAKAVSAKSYGFDDRGNETTIDYWRMMGIVLAAGYHRWLGVEYEGDKHSEPDGIRKTKQLLEHIREGRS